jgi:hypothetical protein
MHVMEAANYSGVARREHGMLARAAGCRTNRISESRKSSASIETRIARKWTFLERLQPGRPRTKIDIEQLILRMAHEKEHLIEPAPARGRSVPWSVFLRAHSSARGT